MPSILTRLAARFQRSLTLEGLVRLAADMVLINLAFIASLVGRVLYYFAFELPYSTGIDYTYTFWDYINSYLSSAWLLTLISMVVFSLNGFYTYGRYYKGRYKVLIVIQAVSVTYLIFGLCAFFLKLFDLPRSAFFGAWGLSIVLLVAARVWSQLWKIIYKAESERAARKEGRQVQTVLVIGGAGYIGSALLPKLLERGYKVALLDLLLYGTDPIQNCLDHPNLSILQADFRQIDKVVEATRNVDAVIHLGGIVGDPACALDEKLTVEINTMATRMIAEVAKGSGVERFIFASTCSVYGASDQKLDERSVLNPVSLYARSKIASEKALQKMADEHFAPVILRLGTIYGLSGRTRFDLVVNLLTAKAVVEGEITVFGGDQWRPFLHVDDAAAAFLQVLEAPLPLVRGQVFNTGSNEQNYTIRQVGELVNQAVPAARLEESSTNIDPRNYWVDFSRLHNALGFAPRWTVEQGIQQVIEALRSGKVKDYRDARYSNVKFLSEEGISRLAREEETWPYQILNGAEPVIDM